MSQATHVTETSIPSEHSELGTQISICNTTINMNKKDQIPSKVKVVRRTTSGSVSSPQYPDAISRDHGGSQSKESNALPHRSFHLIQRAINSQHSIVEADNAHGAKADGQMAKDLTPMDRWQSETLVQAPWNNISAVDVGEGGMHSKGQDTDEQRGQEIDEAAWSTMAVEGRLQSIEEILGLREHILSSVRQFGGNIESGLI